MEPPQSTGLTQTPHRVHQVTTFSRYFALVIIIVLPFLGGYVGYNLNSQNSTFDSGTYLVNVVVPSEVQPLIKRVDIGTSIVDFLMYKDKITCYSIRIDGVYCFAGDMLGYSEIKLTNADPDTFVVLDLPYAKDKMQVYRLGGVLQNADPATFTIIKDSGNKYSKDKNHVYILGQLIPGADPTTFELLDLEVFAKDKNNVYRHGIVLTNVDASTFEYLGSLAKDKNHVYRQSSKYAPTTLEIIPEGDADSLKKLEGSYYIDKNNVYWNSQIIQDADPNTFEVYDLDKYNYYAKDKRHVFKAGELLPGADPLTFQPPL